MYRWVFVAVFLLSACSTLEKLGSVFDGDDEEDESDNTEPVELVEFENSLPIEKLWSGRYGKGTDKRYLKLGPVISGSQLYTADRDGRVLAINVDDGSAVWEQRDKKHRISGGPGLSDDLVIVGTSDAEVIAREQSTGEVLWTTKVSSEVLAAPRSEQGIVVIRTGDGKLVGLDAATGKRRWIYDRNIPTLTLRGSAPPTIYDGVVIAGFDNGRLAAVDLISGKLLWETRLAEPSGRSDLERMVDVDTEPVIYDFSVYVASYQGRVAAISTRDGQLEWTREISSFRELAVDAEHVYVVDEQSRVWALDRFSGASAWVQEDLARRALSGPALFDEYVVVGDFEGYLHWLSTADGSIMHRDRLDKKPILSRPVVAGEKMFGVSSGGELAAYARH